MSRLWPIFFAFIQKLLKAVKNAAYTVLSIGLAIELV